MQRKGLKSVQNSSLTITQFNNATPENNNDSENICSSTYYDIDKMG